MSIYENFQSSSTKSQSYPQSKFSMSEVQKYQSTKIFKVLLQNLDLVHNRNFQCLKSRNVNLRKFSKFFRKMSILTKPKPSNEIYRQGGILRITDKVHNRNFQCLKSRNVNLRKFSKFFHKMSIQDRNP